MSNPKDQMMAEEYEHHRGSKQPRINHPNDMHRYSDSERSNTSPRHYSDSPSHMERAYNSHQIQDMYFGVSAQGQGHGTSTGFHNYYPRFSPQRPLASQMETHGVHIPSSNSIGYQPPVIYSGQQHAPHLNPYHQPQLVYQMTGLSPVHNVHHHQHMSSHSPQRQSPEVYRNLNNQITQQSVNPKLKTQGSAGPIEINLIKNEENMGKKMFPINRTYSNQLEGYTRRDDIEQEFNQQNTVGKRTLHRGVTFDLVHVGEQTLVSASNSGSQNQPINQRFVFQHMKSNSFHPEDRAVNLSPIRRDHTSVKDTVGNSQRMIMGFGGENKTLSPVTSKATLGVPSLYTDPKQLGKVDEVLPATRTSPGRKPGN